MKKVMIVLTLIMGQPHAAIPTYKQDCKELIPTICNVYLKGVTSSNILPFLKMWCGTDRCTPSKISNENWDVSQSKRTLTKNSKENWDVSQSIIDKLQNR